jgi:hypothetical protein
MPGIPNPFSSSKETTKDTTFELVKTVTENEMYSYDYNKTSDFMYTITIGYISSKYVQNIKDTGCLMVMISSQIAEGPNAIFCLARSDKSISGNINTLISSNGKCGDKLDIIWNPMEHPCVLLKHNFTKKQILKDDTKLRLGYNVKVIYI